MEDVYSNLKIVWHPNKLKSFVENKIVAPVQVRIKPTNQCNHHCYYCAYDANRSEENKIDRGAEIPYEKIMEILNDFKVMGVKAVTYSGGGEPLIYSHITETLEKTLNYGIDLSVITNGQRLKGRVAELLKQAKWVRVSLDSCDAKTFKETRRVPEKLFYELIDNLKNFASTKPANCIFGINFVIQEKNANQVYDSIKFFKELGADNIKLTPRHIPKNAEEYQTKFKKRSIEQIIKAKQDFPDFKIYDTYDIDFSLTNVHKRRYNRCYIMQTIPVISADMNVYPCHDKAWIGIDPLGSIKNKSFKELWLCEETAKKFREFNPRELCEHHCTNDLKNIVINNVINCYGEHINFP